VLLPALVVLLVVTVVSYRKWRNTQGRLEGFPRRNGEMFGASPSVP
jgi:hypothetical protein